MKFELKQSFTNVAYSAVATSLANCETFRDLCGVDSVESARKRIHVDTFEIAPIFGGSYAKGEIEKIIPCALICTSNFGSMFGRELAGVGSFHSTGRIALTLYIPVPDEFMVKHELVPEGVRILESMAGEIVMEMERKTRLTDKQYLYFESSRIAGITMVSAEYQATAGNIAMVDLEFNY